MNMKQKIEGSPVTSVLMNIGQRQSSLSNHYPEGSEYYVVCVGKATFLQNWQGDYPDIGMGHFY